MTKLTLLNQPIFIKYISTVTGFQMVNVNNFVGLGTIRYVPPFLFNDTEISEVMHNEIDKLNVEIESKFNKQKLFNSIISSITTDENKHKCIILMLSDNIKEDEIKNLVEILNKISHEVSDSSEVYVFVFLLIKIVCGRSRKNNNRWN